MAHGRSSGRGRVPNRNANRRLPHPNQYTEAFYRSLLDRSYLRYIDLTSVEDRRRYHPQTFDRDYPAGPAPRGLVGRPRILIVPEGHRLARKAPWKATRRLPDVLYGLWQEQRRFPFDEMMLQRQRVHYGVHDVYADDHLSRRVGFSHPWQVIVCVRRKRRREVLHALRKTGRGGSKQRKPRRNFWSEVRC